jgi:DNA-directed RNA polymerase specialized sigma24 family protein
VWEGWTAAQVSERLAIPAGTVHSRYRLALERLRGSLLEGRP